MILDLLYLYLGLMADTQTDASYINPDLSKEDSEYLSVILVILSFVSF